MTELAKNAKNFFSRLSTNNNKLWFDEHRDEYEDKILEPSKEFAMELGAELKRISPNIIVDPRVNKSLFRINRDIRFSKDKTPYKTHLAIFFWEGTAPKMECPGFYFHADSEEVTVGTGLYRFPKEILGRYREIVGDKTQNRSLSRILNKIEKKGFIIGGEHYKRLPKGADPDIPSPNLLLHNGLYVSKTIPNNNRLPDLKALSLSSFQDTIALHRWLVKLCSGEKFVL